MAADWDMAMAVQFGMSIGDHPSAMTSAAGAPIAAHFHTQAASSSQEHFFAPAAPGLHQFLPSAAASPVAIKPEPASPADQFGSLQLSFADQFYIPKEEAAELEWLSTFVDDSYSNIPNYPSVSSSGAAVHAATAAGSSGHHPSGGDTPGASSQPGRGARSKRARATWNSPLLPNPMSSTSSELSVAARRQDGRGTKKAGEVAEGECGGGGVRRCTHCQSEKTPQWRTGPLGPKTLCNACGVRYKSGRLMPEYRPAASPTFVLTQHSNSHRKVMELRRQKELLLLRGHRGSTVTDSNAAGASAAAAAAAAAAGAGGGRPELLFCDYGVC